MLNARLLGADETVFGDARAIFTSSLLARLTTHCSKEALSIPLVFSERLSNRSLAVCIGFRDGAQLVAVNARFMADPELIAHTLVEEYVHAQQRLDGVDMEEQRARYAYADRPYELQAKQIATEILGYAPFGYTAILLREEPPDIINP